MSNMANTIEGVLSATQDQQERIQSILDDTTEPGSVSTPLLMTLTDAARLAGFSRSTLWRLCHEGVIPKVQIRPNAFRIRR